MFRSLGRVRETLEALQEKLAAASLPKENGVTQQRTTDLIEDGTDAISWNEVIGMN